MNTDNAMEHTSSIFYHYLKNNRSLQNVRGFFH